MKKLIRNPYQFVNFTTYTRNKANFHTHHMLSKIKSDGTIADANGRMVAPNGDIIANGDPKFNYPDITPRPNYVNNAGTVYGSDDGSMTVDEAIDFYHERGYSILAITNHDYDTCGRRTVPNWKLWHRDPKELGMLAVEGTELSRGHHHISLFNDLGVGTADAIGNLTAVSNNIGISILAHPGRHGYSANNYIDYAKKYDNLIGIEVVNQRDRFPEDRMLWDDILNELMPARPLWGMSSDDAHRIYDSTGSGSIGVSYNVLYLPRLDAGSVVRALSRGEFYFVYNPDGVNIDHHLPKEKAPIINKVSVDEVTGTIQITAENHSQIRWVYNKEVVATGETFNYKNNKVIGNYVRAEIVGVNGTAYTQPFGFVEVGSENTNTKKSGIYPPLLP